MRSLNLDQLRALETVVALGSFTAAARQLNLSQSAVSTQISELERRFGVRLVERLGKKAYGTSAGREVIERGQQIAREVEAVEAAMRRHREGWLGRVRVAASITALIYHLPPVLRRLRVEHPNIELVVTTGTTAQVVERILRNDIDVGIVSLPIHERDLEVVPLLQEPLVAIFPSEIGDIPAKATPKSLGQYPLILEYARAQVRMLINEWLSTNGAELGALNGSSTFPAHEIVEAHWAAERRVLERPACEQAPYSLLVRGIEADVLPVTQRYGMGTIVWSPLCAGWLTGLYRKGRELPASQRGALVPGRFDLAIPGNQAKLEAVEQLAVLAEENGLTLPQLALGFILEHPGVTSAIIGPRTMEQLETYLASGASRLHAATLDRIDEIVPPGTVFNQADVAWLNPALTNSALRRGGAAPLARATLG